MALLGDGDVLKGAAALWTGGHYRIPLLVVVRNRNPVESQFDMLEPTSIGRVCYAFMVPRRSSNPKRDVINHQAALALLAKATGQSPLALQGKNPAAVALGRMGGLKGGNARARSLSAKRRAEIAKVAALARWKTRPDK